MNNNYGGGYNNRYGYNPYAQRANQGSLLQFTQSNQPYIGRPVNQISLMMERLDSNNRALVEQRSVVDMAMNSIDVDAVNQDIIEKEKFIFSDGIDKIADTPDTSYLMASAQMNKLVSDFQGSQDVKAAVKLKGERDKGRADVTDMYKRGLIAKSQYDKSMVKNPEKKVQYDEHGIIDDTYDFNMPVQAYDVAGFLNTVGSKIKVDTNIGEPEAVRGEDGTVLYYKVPSRSYLKSDKVKRIFYAALKSNTDAIPYLEDIMPDTYQDTVALDGKVTPAIDQYLKALADGQAEAFAVDQNTSKYIGVSGEQQYQYAIKLQENKARLDAEADIAKYKAAVAKEEAKARTTGYSNGIAFSTENPLESEKAIAFNNKLGTSIDDIMESLDYQAVGREVAEGEGWLESFVNTVAGNVPDNKESVESYRLIDNLLKDVTGKGISDYTSEELKDVATLDNLKTELTALKDYFMESGAFSTSSMPETTDKQRENATRILFGAEDATLNSSSIITGPISRRNLLVKTDEGFVPYTQEEFQDWVSDNKNDDGDVPFTTYKLGADNIVAINANTDDGTFSTARILETVGKNGESHTIIVGDAKFGTTVKYFAKTGANRHLVASSNSKDDSRTINAIRSAIVGPRGLTDANGEVITQGVNFPIITGSDIRPHRVEYHANRDNENLAEFTVKLPELNNAVLRANTPSELNMKYKLLRDYYQILSEEAGRDLSVDEIQDMLKSFGVSDYTWAVQE